MVASDKKSDLQGPSAFDAEEVQAFGQKCLKSMQRKINRKELVSIGEAMAAIQGDEKEDEKPAKEDKKEEKKSEEKEDKKEEKKEDKEDKKSEEKEVFQATQSTGHINRMAVLNNLIQTEALDPSHFHLSVPPDVFEKIRTEWAAALPELDCQSDKTFCHIQKPCEEVSTKVKPIGFQMSDFVFELNPDQYLYRATEGKCYWLLCYP